MRPSSIVLPAADGRRRTVIIATHHGDRAMSSVLAAWAELSAASHLRPVMHIECAAPDMPERGRLEQILEGGAWSAESVADTLHRMGELQRIDIVSAATASLAANAHGELAEADAALRSDLRRIAPQETDVFLHRVWIPDSGDEQLAPPAAYIDAAAEGAFVVLPADRQSERTMALPLSSADGDVHAWHVAVEVASLTGLWSTMAGAPLEMVEFARSGLGNPLVRLVRSTCRAARIRAPSPEQMLDTDGLLPLPPGLLPAPDPAHIARAAPPLLYPEEFQVTDDDSAELHERPAARPEADMAATRRSAVETVSGALSQHDDFGDAAERLNAFALDTARVALWSAPIVGADGSGVDSDEALDEARRLLQEASGPVSMDGVPPSGWTKLVRRVLGTADASMLDDGVRAAVGSERYVVLDPSVLAPADGALVDVLSALSPPMHDPAAVDVQAPAGPDGGVCDEAAVDEAVVGLEADGGVCDEAAVDEVAVDEEVDEPEEDDPDGGSSSSADLTLLAGVTRRFDLENELCDERIRALLRDFRDHLRPDSRPEPGVTTFVAYALLGAVLLGLGALVTLTSLRDVLTPDHLPESARLAAFGLISLLATLPPVLRLTPGRSMSAQVRLTLVAAAYAAAATTLLVMARPLEESFLDKPDRWFPAAVVIAAVVGLTITARFREFSGDRSLLGPLAPMVSTTAISVVLLAYIFVMAVAALNYKLSAPAVFEERNWRLLTVLLTTAVTVAGVTGGMIRHIRRRDRRSVRAWKSSVDSYVDQLEQASVRSSVLATMKVHWLASAAVLSRLLHRPFGAGIDRTEVGDPRSPVRKLLILDLDLTDDTRDGFLAELLPLVASRGWLGEQYRRMAGRFTEAERAYYGVSAEREVPLPEHDTYPAAPESARTGEGVGPRWNFARRVYDGAYDGLLRSAADEAVAQAMRVTFMNERAAVTVDAAAGEERTLPALLGELLPEGEDRLPPGSLPPRAQAPPQYTPYVWWPADVAVPVGKPGADRTCRYLRDRGTLLVHAVRVDVSEPVEVEQLVPVPGSRADAAAVIDPSPGSPTSEPLM
ncbi:hypothetical protein [Candidatus Poriferisodalis sp.]|uniref:hypothetical protein n=1 Tax=Candidatus Poriferisodalis sp. TaxID=3101277 RepID=UPI003AF5B5D6